MHAMNTMTKAEEGPALQEMNTSELQTIIGGHVEVYEPVSYPTAGTPWPTPWRAAGFPFPDPWRAAGQQQYVIGS
jgi:bacteriocin-like protein